MSSNKIYTVWLEWDYGQDHLAFSTKEKAINWINKLIQNNEELKEDFKDYEDLKGEGLGGINVLRLDIDN